jgi:hypothetical protein
MIVFSSVLPENSNNWRIPRGYIMSKFFCRFLFLFLLLAFAIEVFGQWTNRYPKIANVSHHVYLKDTTYQRSIRARPIRLSHPMEKPWRSPLAAGLADEYDDARSETPDKKRRD